MFYKILKKLRLTINPELIESDLWVLGKKNASGAPYRSPAPANLVVEQKQEQETKGYYYTRKSKNPQTFEVKKDKFESCCPVSLHEYSWKESDSKTDHVYYPVKNYY